MIIRKCCLWLLLLSVLAAAANAQSIMTTLTGTVIDPSGAVIVGAKITITNAQSGDTRRTVTNHEGYFTVAALPAGRYDVVVEYEGFAKWSGVGVVLNAGDKRNLSVKMEVSTPSITTVEVKATGDSLATVDSGEKSAVVTSKQIQSLSVVGRSAMEYVKILPGFALGGNGAVNKAAFDGQMVGINNSGAGALGGMAINGTTALDIVSDGTHAIDPGANGNTPVNANTEMISELRVLASNFAAENARGPVVISTVAKSGGTDFHGEAYMFARNAAMNAADWENNAFGVPKDDSHYYYPGGNLGGPVLIPGTRFNKDRNKLFFFTGYEYYAQTVNTGVARAAVPTQAMRNGDFTANMGLGATRFPYALGPLDATKFPNGQIPANLIDKGGQILLNQYALPNADPARNNGYNYVQGLSNNQNNYQWMSRVDYSVSDNTKLFVRYNMQRENQISAYGLWINPGDNVVPSPTPILGSNRSDSIATSLTHVFTPTMTNETTFGYTFLDFPQQPQDPKKLQRKDMGFPYKGVFGTAESLPAITSWGGDIPSIGTPFGFNPTFAARKHMTTFGDNLTKVVGTHTMKFGVFWEQVANGQNEWSNNAGYLVYENYAGNMVSRNHYADLLMGTGYVQYNEDRVGPPDNIGYKTFEFFLQDNWKVSRRLTLDYGLRFQHIGAMEDLTGLGLATFDPVKKAFTWNKIDPSVPLSGVSKKPMFYSPRIGFAYDVFGKGQTVIRGGIGWYRFQDPVGDAIGGAWATAKAAGSMSYSCWDTACPALSLLDSAQGSAAGVPNSGTVISPTNKTLPLTKSWSFTINQRLPSKVDLELSYVGNHGSELVTPKYDMNYTPIGAAQKNPGMTKDQLRIYPNFGTMTVVDHAYNSDYNSLQVSLSRNVGHFTFTTNYTFSKATGNLGTPAPSLPDMGKAWQHGILSFNRPHVLNIAYTYRVPDVVKSSAFGKAAVNGWTISGISRVQSGADLFVNGPGGWGVSGNDFDTIGGSLPMLPQMLCDPRSNLKPNQYVNASCIGPVPASGYGTGGWPYVPGPIFYNHDLSLFKTFKFTESKNVEFRASAFNFLNHPLTSFRSGDANLKAQIDSVTRQVTNLSTFGYADYKYGHRIMELALKFHF